MPIFKLKVDGMFVVDMAIAQQRLPLVSMIIKIVGSLQLKIVGECVEAEKQSRLLRLLQCDQMQGNLFSSSGPVDVLEEDFLAGLPQLQQRPTYAAPNGPQIF